MGVPSDWDLFLGVRANYGAPANVDSSAVNAQVTYFNVEILPISSIFCNIGQSTEPSGLSSKSSTSPISPSSSSVLTVTQVKYKQCSGHG